MADSLKDVLGIGNILNKVKNIVRQKPISPQPEPPNIIQRTAQQAKQGFQRVANAVKSNPSQFFVLSPSALRQGQQIISQKTPGATSSLIQGARQIQNPILSGGAQTGLQVANAGLKNYEQGFSRIGQSANDVRQGNYGQAAGNVVSGAYKVTAPSLALAGGLPAAGVSAVLGGGIGGLFNKFQGKDFYEGVGTGAIEGLKARAVTRFTDPIISQTIAKYAPNTSLLLSQLAQRGIGGAGNVVEDEIIGRLDQAPVSNSDRALSFAIGGAVSGNGDLVRGLRDKVGDMFSRVKVSPKTEEIVSKYLRDPKGRFAKDVETFKGKFLSELPDKSGDIKFVKDPNNPTRLVRVGADLKEKGAGATFGAFAGFQQDEQGDFSYNPEAGVMGTVAGMVTTTPALRKQLGTLLDQAKTFKNADDFKKAFQAEDLMDLSDPARHRWGRLLEDGVDEDTGKYMDLKYVLGQYGEDIQYYPDSKVPFIDTPDETVTIYRGTVSGQKEMLPGDFVTFSKEYALSHNNGEKLLTKKVPAKDVVWQGNDFSEWIYSPESLRGKEYSGGLQSIWERATGRKYEPTPKGTLTVPQTVNLDRAIKDDNFIKTVKDKGYDSIADRNGKIYKLSELRTNQDISEKTSGAALGAFAGVGYERDENGNLVPTYNPEAGLAGAAVGTFAGILRGKDLNVKVDKVLGLLRNSETPEAAIKKIQGLDDYIKVKGDDDAFQVLKKALKEYKKDLVTGPGLPRDPLNEPIIQAIDEISVRNVIEPTTPKPEVSIEKIPQEPQVINVSEQIRQERLNQPIEQPTTPRIDSRPQHQIALEKAANAKDFRKVAQILDSIPADDPYKASMERLFRPKADDVFEGGQGVLNRLSTNFKEARELRKNKGKIPLKDRFVANFLDRFGPAKKFDENFFMNMRLLSGGGKSRTEQIVTENLGPVFKKESKRLEGFSQYLALQRMQELVDERGFKRNFDSQQIQEGLTELKAKYGDNVISEMDQSAKELRGFLDQTLTMAQKSGLISEEAAKAAREKNQYYVTFEALGQLARDAGDAKGISSESFNVSKQNVLKTIGDSESGIADPLESTLAKVMRTISESDKNSVLKDFIENTDDSVAIKLNTSQDPPENMGIINLYVDGQKQRYAVPKELETAVKNLDDAGFHWAIKALSYPVQALKRGAVALNLEFFLVNPVRDIQDALFGEASQKGLRGTKDLLFNYSKSLFESASMGEEWAAWRKAGGGSSTFIDQEITKAPEKGVRDLAGNKVEFLGKMRPGRILDFIARTSEETTRLSKFKSDTKAGVEATADLTPFAQIDEGVRKAAFGSREVTLDFAKMGSMSKVLNQLIPFFNVGLIGSEKFLKLAKDNPANFAKAMTVYAGIPAVTTYLWNSQYQDFKDLADYEKMNNVIFMVGDRTEEERNAGAPIKAFKMPIGNLSEPFMQTVNSVLTFTEKRNPQALLDLGFDLIEGFSPVGLPVGTDRTRRFLSNITPQGLKTPVELFSNKNLYTGYQIEPNYIDGEKREDVPAGYRTSKYTGPTAELIGRYTGKFGLSPAQLENAVGTNFGGAGKQVLTATDFLLGSGPEDVSKTPIVRRVYGPRGGQQERDERNQLESERKAIIESKFTGKPVQLAAQASAAEESVAEPTKQYDTYLLRTYRDVRGKVPADASIDSIKGLLNIKDDMKAGSNKAHTKAYDILQDDTLNDTQKDLLLKDLGVTREDAEYYELAKMPVEDKVDYITDEVDSGGIKVLDGMVREVRGKPIITSAVAKRLVEEGMITEEESDALLGKDKEAKTKKKKGGRPPTGRPTKAETQKLSGIIRRGPERIKTGLNLSKSRVTAPKIDIQSSGKFNIPTTFNVATPSFKVPRIATPGRGTVLDNKPSGGNIDEALRLISSLKGGATTSSTQRLKLRKSR